MCAAWSNAVAIHSCSNPKILLEHCPSILRHRLVAGKGTLVFGLLFVAFLETFLLFGFYLMFLGRPMYFYKCTTQVCY